MRTLLNTLSTLCLLLLVVPATRAQVPQTLSYQGYLENAGTPLTTTAVLSFSLWTDPASTNPADQAWSEIHPGVAVTNGLYTVALGSLTTFASQGVDFSATYWLETAVDEGSGPVTLSPRTVLQAVPYAFHAMNAGTSGNAWDLTGNSATTPGANFLGTMDNAALEVKVNGQRALRIEPTVYTPNVIGGHASNSATPGVIGATVSGGGFEDGSNVLPNVVIDNYGTVGGGGDNKAGDIAGTNETFATVSGGFSNTASGYGTTVSGGVANIASDTYATVGGGFNSTASGYGATVGGGQGNMATADYATIGGGGSFDVAEGNRVTDEGGTVAGGKDNQAGDNDSILINDVPYATVGGGQSNTASGNSSTVGGGSNNEASGISSMVGGGDVNTASGDGATIGGGAGNAVTALLGTIGGGGSIIPGEGNRVTDEGGTVAGGKDNQAGDNAGTTTDATFATVGGGYTNRATGIASTVGGGSNNTASVGATVGGGDLNKAIGIASTVGGGVDNSASDIAATIGGGQSNAVTAPYGTIGGGGSFDVAEGNRVTDEGGTVAGGRNNLAGDSDSTNTDAAFATVGGGFGNRAIGYIATVGGGDTNTASGYIATVSGGRTNDATGKYATVPGGLQNTASGEISFAAGRRAKANHNGSFVWGDYTDADIASTANNQFIARASGGTTIYSNSAATIGVHLAPGAGSWTSASSVYLKTDFQEVDASSVLAKVVALPVWQWRYKAEAVGLRHVGPMAQDFYGSFGLGATAEGIGTVDADGVALAAIQGLHALLVEKDARIEALQRQLDDLQAQVSLLLHQRQP